MTTTTAEDSQPIQAGQTWRSKRNGTEVLVLPLKPGTPLEVQYQIAFASETFTVSCTVKDFYRNFAPTGPPQKA